MPKANVSRVLLSLLVIGAGIVGLTLSVQAAPAAGSLIKRPDHPAVYYLATNGKRYVFPNERVFQTWYLDFSTVQTVTADELAAIPIGGNVTYRPGFRMIKIDTDPKVYAISRGGVLRPIASEAVAAALFGPGWAKLIDDIPDAFFVNYAMGTALVSASDFNRDAELGSVNSINGDKNLGNIAAAAPLPPPPDRVAENPCSADVWYCQEWGSCSAGGTQTRFCTMTYNCPNVQTPMPPTTQSCTPPPNTCTEDVWYCAAWNVCSAAGTQDRVCVISQDCPNAQTPSPPTTQSCTPPAQEPACTADTWYCTAWNTCSPDGQQDRVCVISQDCPNAQTPMPTTTQSCEPAQ